VTDALDRFARDFRAGTVLFQEGQPGDFMYVVQTGAVEIRRRVGEAERVLAVLPPGEFLGEMAILNGRPRSATAVVSVDSRLLVIEGTTFEAMMRARPAIAMRIIKALATRPESANQPIHLLLVHTHVLPSDFNIHTYNPVGTRSWRLIAPKPEGTLCHKPCTVSGGGKS